MGFEFEKTQLWKRTLGQQHGDDPHADARSRLRTAFLKTRLMVEPLVAQIGKELPQLTVHDITHLDALWEVADLIIGPDYPMNPAEAFVLGMSFLIHDAATSTAAYAGKIEEIKHTVEWRDIVAQRKYAEDKLNSNTPEYQSTLFEVLRVLHPRQAEKLLLQTWKDFHGIERYLLDDVELRNHYAKHIGEIAHSHWWYPEKIDSKWSNAPAVTPHSCLKIHPAKEWAVDCLKVALILRCADAAHIDSRRAPDMLASLVSPIGVSRLHWHFQNKLGLASITEGDEPKLYWSTGQSFSSSDAQSWWLLYDAAQMIDKEIRTSNQLLRFNARAQFFVTGVYGANDSIEFAANIPTANWHPVNVGFKVTQVHDVVEKFGGKELYGDYRWKALRELLQNAADAIRARRALHGWGVERGRIDVWMTKEGQDTWLHVKDDGIGMSRYVLTEVLLDFGRSLWKDNVLRSERPGLASSGFSSTGKFGIGFLSVFMLGQEVKVTTWPDGRSADDVLTLHIPVGVRSRPIISGSPELVVLHEPGTCISVRLDGYTGEFAEYFSFSGADSMPRLLGVLSPTIDIDVFIDRCTKIISANDWLELESNQLFRRLYPSLDKVEDYRIPKLISVNSTNREVIGRLSLENIGWGGGDAFLTHNGITVAQARQMYGALLAKNNSDLSRDEASPIANAVEIIDWVKRSIKHAESDITRKSLSLGVRPSELIDLTEHTSLLNPNEVEELLGDNDSIIILTKSPITPAWCSEDQWESFSLFDNVVDFGWSPNEITDFNLENWFDMEFRNIKRMGLADAQLEILKQAWPSGRWQLLECAVGEISGREVEVDDCIVFYPQ